MFIQNFEAISERFECKKIIGEYIQNNFNIPPLSIKENGDYVFAKTVDLEGAIIQLPFYLRAFC